MSGSNYCLLSCIQVPQDTSKMVCYSHFFKNFPQFVVIHTIKSFSIVSEAEVDVFLEFSCFFYDPVNVGDLISGFSAFSKSSLYIWTFSVHTVLKPSLKDFEQNLAIMLPEHNLNGIFFLTTLPVASLTLTYRTVTVQIPLVHRQIAFLW